VGSIRKEMSNIEKPLTKDEMVKAIVDEVEYWDLDILIGWVQAIMKNELDHLSYQEVHDEYTFHFEED
jgi:hypothetical protein